MKESEPRQLEVTKVFFKLPVLREARLRPLPFLLRP